MTDNRPQFRAGGSSKHVKKDVKQKKKSSKSAMVPPSQRRRRRWTADDLDDRKNKSSANNTSQRKAKQKNKQRKKKRFSLGHKNLQKKEGLPDVIPDKLSYKIATELLGDGDDDDSFRESGPKKKTKAFPHTRSRSDGAIIYEGDDVNEKREHKESLYHYGRQLHRFKLPNTMPSERTLNQYPEQKLNLEHVYGYKGESLECKNNICISFDKKTLIYCKSSLVILLNTENNTQKFFRQHTREVSSITIWPNEDKTIAASGQHPDPALKGRSIIFVWDYVTLQLLRRFEHSNCATISLQFSPHFKSVYAMNSDDDHSIIGFSLNKKLKKRPQTVSFNASKSAAVGFVCQSLNSSHENTDYFVIFGRKLLKFGELSSKDKGETFTNVSKSSSPKLRTVRVNNNGERGFYCAIFPSDRLQYIAGGHSGQLYKCEKSKALTTFQAFESPILSLACLGEGNILACCAEGLASIIYVKGLFFEVKRTIDLNSNPCIRHPVGARSLCYNHSTGDIYLGLKTSQITHMNLNSDEPMHKVVIDAHCGIINSVDTHPNLNLVVTGGSDGYIRLWDYIERRCLSEQTYGDPQYVITNLLFSPNGQYLVAGLDKSTILFFTLNPLRLAGTTNFSFKSDASGVTAISVSADGSMAAIGFQSGDIRVCTVQIQGDAIHGFEWGGKKNMRTCASAILDIQWSFRVEYIRVFTRGYSFEHFRVHVADRFIEKHTDKVESTEQWFGRPLRAGWDVRGLYQPGFDGSYLQCVARSQNGTLIAAGDRKGVIRIHNYPAHEPKAHYAYTCHSNCANDVVFSNKDEYIFSVASDGALFQWEIDGEMLPAMVEVDWHVVDSESEILAPSFSEVIPDVGGLARGSFIIGVGTPKPDEDLLPLVMSNMSNAEADDSSAGALSPTMIERPSLALNRAPSSHIQCGQLTKQESSGENEMNMETWSMFITDIQQKGEKARSEFFGKMDSLRREARDRLTSMANDPFDSPAVESEKFISNTSSQSRHSISRQRSDFSIPVPPVRLTIQEVAKQMFEGSQLKDDYSRHTPKRVEFTVGDIVEGRVDGVWLTGTLIATLDNVFLFKFKSEQHLLKRSDLRRPNENFTCGEKCHGLVEGAWRPGIIALERNGVFLFKADSGIEALLINSELKTRKMTSLPKGKKSNQCNSLRTITILKRHPLRLTFTGKTILSTNTSFSCF